MKITLYISSRAYKLRAAIAILIYSSAFTLALRQVLAHADGFGGCSRARGPTKSDHSQIPRCVAPGALLPTPFARPVHKGKEPH